MTRPFCGSCDRIRLTADGQLRSCLFAVDEVDLRALVRDGESSDDDGHAVQRCVARGAGYMIGQGDLRQAPPPQHEPDRRLTAASIRACRCISPA